MNRNDCNISESKCFTIYNQRLAGYLMQHGFPLRFLVKRENERNKFLFDNTEALQAAIHQWDIDRR